MANLTVYTVQLLQEEDSKIFAGLYTDFKSKAMTDFKFELEPLEFEDFINAIKNGLLKCLVLYENSIPTGFLVYTTLISYSVELNIIYLNSEENYESKIRNLLNDFFDKERDIISKKVITYPLLGEQEKYKDVLTEYGFDNISQSVLIFDFSNPASIRKINDSKSLNLPDGFKIKNWDIGYIDNAVKLIHDNFQYMNDALFDSRFKTKEGVYDIIEKITNSTYGEFLPQYTKVLIKDYKPIGICFLNVTSEGLLNIPLVAIDKFYRSQGLGKKLVSTVVREVLEDTLNGKNEYSKINVTTDTFNVGAMKMYDFTGFIEDYRYQQSFKEPNIISA